MRWCLLFVLVSCGGATSTKPPAEATHAKPDQPTRRAVAAFTLPAPTLGIDTPLRGEPDGRALDEARLEPTSCERVVTTQTDATIKEMRAAVDAAFLDWVREQPACWQAMREEWRARHATGPMWGDAFGSGVGLTGVGEGGGGRGEGIGLGSFGTVGHGSGSGFVARKATSFSKTNNQVASVDEADMVKTDGAYVYVASKGALRIIEALAPKVRSVTAIPGAVRELFVEGDRAVVYSSQQGTPAPPCTYGYDCELRGDGTSTLVSVFDVRDRDKPALVREMKLSGSLLAARRIGNAVHTVVADNDAAAPPYQSWPSDLSMCGNTQPTVVARLAKLKVENEKRIRAETHALPTITERGVSKPMCTILKTASDDGGAFTSVVSFDMTKDDAPTTATMRSRPGAVYASDSGLYVAVRRDKSAGGRWYSFYPSEGEVSEIHKFRIGAAPSETKYTGSGTIPGHVLNQFAMDEWYGYLRVATTKGRVPDPSVKSALSILAPTPAGALVRVGAIDGIAPGEDIRSVRFDNERGYVVTFKKTDPLFVLDTLDPQRPKVLGELKIPGFSTYMHRIDPDHLLSIGFDANDHGDFAYFDGVILQLFDVKDPKEPKLLHKEKIGTRGSSSEAATNHLAFNYMRERGLLAVPMTICEGGGDGVSGDKLAFSGLLVYDVDVERGFERLGGVDHGRAGASCGTWWSQATSHVKRSVFIDDLVYSVAEDRVKVQRLSKLGVDFADLDLTATSHAR